MIERRTFLASTLSLLAAPLLARAQQPSRQRRIGLLLPNAPEVVARNPRMAAFLRELRELGWVEGQNVVFERRSAEGQLGRLAELADELVRAKVDVIVAAAAPSAVAAKAATTTIPVVMLDPGDPVALGLVAGLARPGGNVTGVTSIAPELAAKRLALLKEAAPKIARVAVLFNAAIPPAEIALKELQAAADVLGVRVQSVAAEGSKGLDEAFQRMAQERTDGAIVFPDPLTFSNQQKIVSFAAANRIAALFGAHEFVEAGGLMSYGPSYPDMFRRGAHYVDRILKGARPADLPVEQPTRFELFVNLKTAQALGLIMPQSILLRADRLIE